jgi:hypothetical protein
MPVYDLKPVLEHFFMSPALNPIKRPPLFNFSLSPLQIQVGAGALIAGANVFAFSTIYSFFVFFGHETDEFEMSPF